MPDDTLTTDKLLALAESLPKPKVRRVLVTRVVPDEECGLLLKDAGWLLVGHGAWDKVRDEIPQVNSSTLRFTGLPVEVVRPNSKRERQILEKLGAAICGGVMSPPVQRRGGRPMTDEAQGVEVVAGGWMHPRAPEIMASGHAFSITVHDRPYDERQPVLIVRDTPEARRALGVDPREAEASREGSKET